MKDYMMLFRGADYGDLGLSPEDVQARMGKWFAWGDKMAKAGHLVGGEALNASTMKRVSGPNRTVSDGPFGEGKELIGGYYIVKANSVEEVVEISQDYPDYDLDGTVEIREIVVFEN
ncbi:YciI family protein [Saprospiraceae bacterium]|nr:YciI family protein [Saprospiraceae bacterium]